MSDWFRAQPKIGAAAPPRPAAKLAPWSKAATPTQLPDNKAGVSAKVVMHHFARSEVHRMDQGADAVHARVVAKLRTQPEFYLMNDAQLTAAIQQMAFYMQSCDLTINFTCYGWFDRPNGYKTYTQMYERGTRKVKGTGGAEELRLSGNAMNPADSRDVADTRVSFAPNVSTPGMQGVARFMQTGGLTPAGTRDGKAEFTIANQQFNPKAKPIFAGLNIGHRPHGSTTSYGMSHLVLKNHFKANAIYYMGDTFFSGHNHSHRITFGTLPALFLYAKNNAVLGDLINASYRNMQLRDSSYEADLVEAHIYGDIVFSQAVKEVVVSRRDITICHQKHRAAVLLGGDPRSLDEIPQPHEIENNAKIFAHSNHIGIRFVE